MQEFGRLYVPDLGRPGIPIRLMAGLHLLKHTYGLSDEDVVNPTTSKLNTHPHPNPNRPTPLDVDA